MQGSTKAEAMLDLWASVKRARAHAPHDRGEARDRKARPRPLASVEIAPAHAAAE
jgi:hypothetical protein